MRRRLADGTVRVYEYPLKLEPRHRPHTFGAVAIEFKQSAEYRAMKPGSRQQFEIGLARLSVYSNVPIRDIKRRDVKAARDADQDRPAAANLNLYVFVRILSYALECEFIEFHPALRIRKLKIGEHARWPDEAVSIALDRLPEPLARGLALALYTGQRIGDVTRMLWSDYDGTGIQVAQQKTGERLWIPAHRDLKTLLDRWPRIAPTILTTSAGRPWGDTSFSVRASREMRKIPELDGLVVHGLRKTAASLLAEAGCSVHEIAAITGHRAIAMVQHYTRGADQKRRASAAILKLENARRKTPENGV